MVGVEHIDRRDQFVRALWRHADGLRLDEFENRARTGAITALVRIAVNDGAVMNAYQAMEIKMVGPRLGEVLTACEKSGSEPTATQQGRHASAAGAILAVLAAADELVPMGDLLSEAGRLLESDKRFKSLDSILEFPGSCTAWAQMTPLENGLGWVKRRMRTAWAGKCGFELTALGREAAETVVARVGTGADSKGALRRFGDAGQRLLLVDDREGGGDAHGLGDVSRRLALARVPHETRRLPSGWGDYCVTRNPGKPDELDALDGVFGVCERKTAVDLADSLVDGRWTSQYKAMLSTARRLGLERIVYVVEGDPKDHVHRACGCGCHGVGRCGNPKVDDVEAALAARARESLVEIHRTADSRATAAWLAAALPAPATQPHTPKKVREAAEVKQESPAKKTKKAGEISSKLAADWQARDADAMQRHPLLALKTLCESLGENTSGSKKELVARLLQKPMPSLLATRRKRGGYTPHDRSCAHAIMCALEQAQRRAGDSKTWGLTKDAVMAAAEATGVSKVSLFAKAGPMGYDGWACAQDLQRKGEPPLVRKVGSKFALTTRNALDDDGSVVRCGRDVATALHFKAHQRDWCACRDPPPPSELTALPQLHDLALFDSRTAKPAAAQKPAPVKKPATSRPLTAFFAPKPAPATPPTIKKSRIRSEQSDDDPFDEPAPIHSKKIERRLDLEEDDPFVDDVPSTRPARNVVVDLTMDSPELARRHSTTPHKRSGDDDCIDLTGPSP